MKTGKLLERKPPLLVWIQNLSPSSLKIFLVPAREKALYNLEAADTPELNLCCQSPDSEASFESSRFLFSLSVPSYLLLSLMPARTFSSISGPPQVAQTRSPYLSICLPVCSFSAARSLSSLAFL